MQKSIIGLSILASSFLYGGFDFGGSDGSGCEGGDGTFQQQIEYWNNDPEKVVTVGTIPKDLKDVYISLKSDEDVDIRLYDANGKKIVHWPNGILHDYGKGTTTYNGVTVEYSGYNGDGTGSGHEYIKISGTTQNDFVMKAFGYKAGYAKVDYSWAGKANCSDSSTPSASGSGDFEQQIVSKDIVKVGDIPPKVNNLYITLKSDEDVDIQLYDKDDGTKIIVWPDGILNGHDKQTTSYQGMQIEWSGYNGDGTGLGHEYIKITGETTRNLTMKAYGYQAGYAQVHYEWGGDIPINPPVNEIKLKSVKATPFSGKSYAETNEDINFKVLTKGDNIKVYIHFFDGYNYLPKDEMSGGNGVWTFTRAIKNPGNRKYKVTIEDIDGNVLKTHEAYIEVKNSSSISLAVMNNYINEYKGQCIDMDGAYGCQCMDLMHHYVEEVLGIPRAVSPLKSGGPDTIYNSIFKNISSKTLSYGSIKIRLDKIPNTATSIPHVGDIIIWKATKDNGWFGHVGIFISGDVNSFKSFDQNWSPSSLIVGSPAKIINHNYNNVIGYLRPVLLSE